MRRYKIVEETKVVHTHEVLDQVTCALCKKTSKSLNWGTGYKQRSATVECEDVNCWPDCRDGILYTIDICPDCFIDRLMPWVVEQGGDVTEKELY